MKYLLSAILICLSLLSWATHNRAGEISYEQIGPNQFRVTLVTYTRIDSDADRPFIDIIWGDGQLDSLSRDASYPEVVADDVYKNVYVGIHTYPGPGNYTISLEDPNRNEGVNNIPNSINVPFYIESEILINPFLGNNSSPVLLNAPVDDACLSSSYIHNPSAFDKEGDSLSYSLVPPKGIGGQTISGYTIPGGVSIDSITGTLTWLSPNIEGEFNFAILIEEYRNGFLIGSMVRDMQVTVKQCSNHSPVIAPFTNICIEAGQPINLAIKATDSDSAEAITLSATGGPLTEVLGNLALFPSGVIGIDSVQGTFKWNTQCPHVRKKPYQVIFKAEDNNQIVSLIDLATLNITVIGPETKNIQASSNLNGIDLSWDPNPCTDVIGYKIFRQINSNPWQHDTCETGVPVYTGYSQVGSTNSINTTTFFDSTTIQGNVYCYRIVACYPDGAESYSSIEVCSEPFEVSPIPTHVDVKATAVSNGEIYVQWNNPKNLDSLKAIAPFFYKVYEIQNNIKNLCFTSSGLSDTSFTNQNINTESTDFTYQIELIGTQNGVDIVAATSENASSVFLEISSLDDALQLNWEANTPWANDTFVILKETTTGSGVFNPIDTITQTNFVDSNLVNGTTYCYKIQAWGYYSSPHFNVPFINHSQINCGIPEDNTSPCPPNFYAISDCKGHQNSFSWSIDNMKCNDDVQLLNIYFKSTSNDDFFLLHTAINPLTDTSFTQSNMNKVAGCYAFSAIDSVGNESDIVQEVCFDNCPYYQIPNIFTPNQDGINDILTPLPYRYIQSIDLIIYNRWGQQVFETKDVDINWDGRNQFTKLKSSSGVYYYRCIVEEIKIDGIQQENINGFIQIIN
jgi:gliding motility-associated-like protein